MKRITSSRETFLIGIFALTITTIPLVQAQGGTTAAVLTDDTYYDFFYPTQPYNETANWLESTFKVSLRYISFLKFNISSVPEGAEGITAVLELYTAVGGVPVQHFVDVYSHNDTTWDEEVRLPSSDLEHNAKKLDTEWVASNERWYEWNVTNGIIEAIFNSSSAVTFMVMYPYGQDRFPVSFTSKDDTLTKMPKLTITWTAIPEYSFFIVPLVIATTTAVLISAVLGSTKNQRFKLL